MAGYMIAKINMATGFNLGITTSGPSYNCITFKLDPSLDLKEEGYTLKADQDGVTITAKTAQGAFYGMQHSCSCCRLKLKALL